MNRSDLITLAILIAAILALGYGQRRSIETLENRTACLERGDPCPLVQDPPAFQIRWQWPRS